MPPLKPPLAPPSGGDRTAPHEVPITLHRGGIGPTRGGVTRRQVLGAMAASAALAEAGCSPPPHPQMHPWVDLPEARGGGLPLYYASAWVRDGFAQGVLIGTQEGRPIKIEGNPRHPASLGGTDAQVQASVLELWDPDRSTVVRQRVGAVPATRIAPSSWAAFEAAWRARAGRRQHGRDGAALHLLTGPLTSPTALALIASLLEREPAARWHVHAPLRDDAAEAGVRQAFGRPARPVLHLDRARCIIALAADPFSDGPGAIRHAMDWSAARADARERGAVPPPTFAAEATPGLFGARADVRVAMAPAQIEAMLWRLAARWIPEAAGSDRKASNTNDTDAARFEARAAAALVAAGPDALVIGGPGLSAEAHALILALNQRLGALGHTLDLIEPPDAAHGAGTPADLARALEAGEVDTLVIVGANPAYDAPAGLALAASLRLASMLVHAGLHVDETAVLADWHLPLSHAYEQWADARAHEGSATLMQPAIAPLYDTRSAIELLALLQDDDLRDGHALVQRYWRKTHASDFDAFWRASVRTGIVAGSAGIPIVAGAARVPARGDASSKATDHAEALVALFAPDASLRGGEYANNGWLQELPRPASGLTWDNAVLLGPDTARRLGLVTGDVVIARSGGASVEAPVRVFAAQAEDVAVLPLGGGRRQAGRVGDGVGFDAGSLRATSAWVATVMLRKTERRHEFALTQHETTQHDRHLARTLPPGGSTSEAAARPSLYPPSADPVHGWAMVIDLDACIGCNACTIACQAENNIPVVGPEQVAAGRVMHWIRVDRYDATGGRSLYQPVPCMHCEQAPCELVCPVGATVHDTEGLNVQVYNRCVGTRFCSNNCPYKVRRFNFLQFTDETSETLKAQRNPDVTVRQRGVMEKCSYCLQRISRARRHEQATGAPIVDGDVVTACQGACPTRAIHFGDLRDRKSDVNRAKVSPRHYAMLGELGTRPRTTYLARIEAAEDET